MIIGTNEYDMDFLRENMMGPNSMRIIDELSRSIELQKGMKVLDLGCGKGLTSIFLAKEFGATVFAVDLWIGATENYQRFKALGLQDHIIPIHAEAHDLPFAEEFFDAAVSVDAYQYFGADKDYLTKHLAPLVKRGGEIAVAVPGVKREEFASEVPEELLPYWVEDMNFHSSNWWRDLWALSDLVSIKECREMSCHDLAWKEWLTCDNDYARKDIKMMKDEGGKYFNLTLIRAARL